MRPQVRSALLAHRGAPVARPAVSVALGGDQEAEWVGVAYLVVAPSASDHCGISPTRTRGSSTLPDVAITPITITWEVVNPDNATPVSGGVMFQLVDGSNEPVTILDSGSGETVQPQPIPGIFVSGVLLAVANGGGGYPPLVLLANDDPTTLPVGTTYLVTEQLAYGSLPPWNLTVHHSSPGATLAIPSQRPTPT